MAASTERRVYTSADNDSVIPLRPGQDTTLITVPDPRRAMDNAVADAQQAINQGYDATTALEGIWRAAEDYYQPHGDELAARRVNRRPARGDDAS